VGCVAKTHGEHAGREAHLLLSLGRHSKQAGDEGDRILDVSLPHTVYLPLANHVHHLVALQGSPRGLERKEAHPRLDQAFDKAMVLLNQVIQVFDLPQFDRFGKDSSRFELGNGFGIVGIFIDSNDTRSRRSGVGVS